MDIINIDIDLCCVSCPKCGKESVVEKWEWQHEKCPHCGIEWEGFDEGDLIDGIISLSIDKITCHVTVLPLFRGAEVEHLKIPGVKLIIVDGPWKTPLGNIQYVVAGDDGKKWAVKKENLRQYPVKSES